MRRACSTDNGLSSHSRIFGLAWSPELCQLEDRSSHDGMNPHVKGATEFLVGTAYRFGPILLGVTTQLLFEMLFFDAASRRPTTTFASLTHHSAS